MNAFSGQAVAGQTFGDDPVLDCLAFLARQYDRPASPVLLKAGLALDAKGRLPFHQIERALEHAGMRGDPSTRPLKRLRKQQMPAVIKLVGGRAAVLLDERDGDLLTFLPGTAEPVWVVREALAADYEGTAVLVEADPTRDRESERPWQKAARIHWFWSEVRKVRRQFMHVALAAAVINLLALALP